MGETSRGIRIRWAWERTRNGDGRVGMHVHDGVGPVVGLYKSADGQRRCDAGEELWGGVAGVDKEGALSVDSWCVLSKQDAMVQLVCVCSAFRNDISSVHLGGIF